jgi:hypothetical protein
MNTQRIKCLLGLILISILAGQTPNAAAVSKQTDLKTPLPLTWTVDERPEFANLQYKRLLLTNDSQETIRVRRFSVESSNTASFFVCNPFDDPLNTTAQCPSFTKTSTPTSQTCFRHGHDVMTIPSKGSCFVWVKTQNSISSNDHLTNSTAQGPSQEIHFTASVLKPDHGGHYPTISLKAKLIRDVKLYIGGNFDQAGSAATTSRIASFDGINFAPVGNGISPMYRGHANSQINALVMLGGRLYVAGQFEQAYPNRLANNIASWDGQQWHNLPNNPPNQAFNGINTPVNALKVWQRNLNDKDSEELFLGYNWGGLTRGGNSSTWMLSIWKQNRWYGLDRNRFTSSGGKCVLPRTTSREEGWGIRSLAIIRGAMMVGGVFCISSNSSFVANRSFGLRKLYMDSRWEYGPNPNPSGFGWGHINGTARPNIAYNFSGFSNSPLGAIHDGHPDEAPDVRSLFTLNVGGQESLLVGGSYLMQRSSDRGNPRGPRANSRSPGAAAFEYSVPGTNQLVPIYADWASNEGNSIRSFAEASEEHGTMGTPFYMAGRNLPGHAYVVQNRIQPDNTLSTWTEIGGWVYSAANPNDMVYTMINIGNKLYIGGRFDRAGPTHSQIVSNIAVLEGNAFQPLRMGYHVGVTRWSSGTTATVNAMLAAPSLTVSDLRIE